MNKNKTLWLELPKALIESLRKVKGFDEASFVKVHDGEEQVTSIRMNMEKLGWVEKGWRMNSKLSEANKISWCSDGFYLNERPSFTLDPLFHAGVYYVQEASSMFLWEVLKQTVAAEKELKALDLCAAPGGKSTLLASYFKDGLLVANEVIRQRANVLVENLNKWGSGNVVITNNDPKDFAKLEGFFDVMVIDAPCSGSGLFRKDNDAINEWSEDNVKLCSMRQQRIVADVLPALKEEGVLIYCTCSYSKEEDEDVIDWMVKEFGMSSCKLVLKDEWNVVETVSDNEAFGYRFYPDKVQGEGFFIAALKKGNGRERNNYISHSFSVPSKQEVAIVNEWIKGNEEVFLFKQNEKILAIPIRWKNEVALLQKHLYLRKAGVALGSLKHKDLVPEHELAMSLMLSDNISSIELNEEQAIEYLRKKEIYIESDIKGWALATYSGVHLGWMKILPNRINNYYPAEWRILKY